MSKAEIIILDAAAAKAAIRELADVLADCVAGGASVSFMLPFGHDDAAKFFEKVIASVARGETVLVAAKLDGRIAGTVQLGMTCRRTSRIAPISRNCWCTAWRAITASAQR